MRSRLVEHHREKVFELAARHGATEVRVFGSLNRGEGTEIVSWQMRHHCEPRRPVLAAYP